MKILTIWTEMIIAMCVVKWCRTALMALPLGRLSKRLQSATVSSSRRAFRRDCGLWRKLQWRSDMHAWRWSLHVWRWNLLRIMT